MRFQFITASHNLEVLATNLARSICIQKKYGLDIRFNFTNISAAYNSASIFNHIVCYAHHDVYLPVTFENDLIKALEVVPDDWAVLGVAGCRLENGKKKNFGYIRDRGNVWGKPDGLPAEVQTLDEMLLITRGDFRFDENLSQDFYGADICMQAHAQGRKCYAINAFCEHNSSRPVGGRTPAFYEAREYFKNKWTSQLPIVTTCALLEK